MFLLEKKQFIVFSYLMDKSLVEIYNEFAATYEANRGMFDMSEIFDSFYHCLNVNNGHVLDLACGAGEPFAANFVNKGWLVTGVDFSSRMLQMAARFVPDMRVICEDIRKVRFSAGEFDAVTIIYALFHLSRDDHQALFEKIHDWLRPGGKLLFTYATQEYTGQKEFDGYKEFMGRHLYYSHKSPGSLRRDLERLAFEIEGWDYRGIGGETFLWVTAGKPV